MDKRVYQGDELKLIGSSVNEINNMDLIGRVLIDKFIDVINFFIVFTILFGSVYRFSKVSVENISHVHLT